MFALAILIGIYSYSLFALGVVHLLNPFFITAVTLAWLGGVVWWFKLHKISPLTQLSRTYRSLRGLNALSRLFVVLLVLIWGINAVGALTPELSFDALWYHLTIPKIFLQENSFFYIPGGLYFYSLMSKLIDMLYIPAVMFNSDVGAKLIHYVFGILTVVVLYRVSRNFLSRTLSLFVILIFSSNLVVAWESTTAYIDLGRTFFEVMVVYGIILFIREKKELWLLESAIMLGFAITTKLIAAGSLFVIIPMVLYLFKKDLRKGVRVCSMYILAAVLVPLPYFIFSWLQTGNPVYPIFTDYITATVLPIQVSDIWNVFVRGADPINPIYVIVFPLILLAWNRFTRNEKLIGIYVGISFIVWLVTPRTGGGRFILPYLPIFSLLVGLIINRLQHTQIQTYILIIGVITACITVGYRGIASTKYIPVLLGSESKNEYLKNNLNFSYGDFYDIDGHISQLVTQDDTVLVFGIHNLWYADFPFVHESYAREGDEFNYILAPDTMRLPERFAIWIPVYSNAKSGVTLYSQGGNTWVY